MLTDPGLESKVRLVSAITTLLQNAPELGNSQLKVECSQDDQLMDGWLDGWMEGRMDGRILDG